MNNSHSTPTPPVDPRTAADAAVTASAIAIPAERRSRRTRVLIAGGLAAAVGIVSIGGQLIAAPSVNASEKRSMQTESELGDVTLDELAAELEDLGLTLRVEPAGDAADDSDDPFEGYTDAEIDAMSDEEFYGLLGEEDWSDEDWSDEGWGDDDWADEESHADHDHDHSAGEEDVLGTFAVTGDTIDLSGASSPEAAAQAQEIWERFVKLIPADQRQMLTSFELNPAEASGAYVYPNDEDPSTWSMGVSLGLGEDLDYVLIHEFAHLLTLQAEEVPPGVGENSCPTYFTGEGCALSGSTMAEFVQRFWPESQREEVARLQDSGDWDGIDAFYNENRDDFVTDYATTNPAEDLAETFTVFVLNDRPTGNTIADQKVNLLWADADMVELRNQIRANR